MAFTYARPHAEVWVPDGAMLGPALGRTTELGIVAHQDDLEFACLAPIAACLENPERWFTGVACTDGAGSARSGAFADCSDEEMRVLRRQEQRAAAEIGGYSAILQLGHPSADVRGGGHATLVDELVEILVAAQPVNVYTHNLADKHSTHLAVVAATVEAVRRLPAGERPWRLVGIEGWRSLDWLSDDEKILLDTSGHRDLAQRLSGVFASQIEGGKRYDLAEEGRRRANATMLEPRAVDDLEELTLAMDLTPLVHNVDLDPVTYVTAAIDRLKADVSEALESYFPR